MARLNPPKNYRETVPRCCPTCKNYKSYGEGAAVYAGCERDAEDGPVGDVEDYLHVCDYYKAN